MDGPVLDRDSAHAAVRTSLEGASAASRDSVDGAGSMASADGVLSTAVLPVEPQRPKVGLTCRLYLLLRYLNAQDNAVGSCFHHLHAQPRLDVSWSGFM